MKTLAVEPIGFANKPAPVAVNAEPDAFNTIAPKVDEAALEPIAMALAAETELLEPIATALFAPDALAVEPITTEFALVWLTVFKPTDTDSVEAVELAEFLPIAIELVP